MATPPNQMGLTGPVQANDIVMRASEIGTTIPGIASLAMKSARKGAQRGVQGIYQLPSGNEPTPEFMNVSQQNLNNQTQQMTDMLNMMAPEDEQLAYINEEEAGILKLLGGSGEMTPQGIPTYKNENQDMSENEQRRFGIDKNLLKTEVPKFYGAGEHKVKLAYITEPEAEILEELDLYDSNPPHEGPGGIPNYNDSGGSGKGMGGMGSPGDRGGIAERAAERAAAAAAAERAAAEAEAEANRQAEKEALAAEIAADKAAVDAVSGGLGGSGMPAGFVEEEGEAEATAAAVEKAKEDAYNAMRPNIGDITGGYDTPTGDMPNDLNPDLGPEGKKTYDAIKDAEQAIKDAVVTNINPNTNVKTTVVDGFGNPVIAGTQKKKAEQNLRDIMTRSDFVDSVRQAEEFIGPYQTLDEYTKAQDLTDGYGQSSLSGMEGRLAELTAKAKANTLEGDELNELAQLNEFYGKNPTTGMGFLESLEYQVTNPEFQADLKKAAPLLGAAALTAFAPFQVKSIFSIGKLLMDVTGKTPQSLRDTIQDALNKLTGGEKKALAKSLPSTYKGFGIQGENRGGGGEDREAAKREAERKAREDAERKAREEEENNRKQDRFQRSFANRYFIGPASLDAVRKYATTEGGYNQLTPFYGREKETV